MVRTASCSTDPHGLGRPSQTPVSNSEQWEAALLSCIPEAQAAVIQLAEAAARVHGLLAAV